MAKNNKQAANFPFCTIEPNLGVMTVPDERLNKLAEIVHPGRIVPATCEIVDIAGLVKGTEQIAQEGAIQIFKLPNSGMEEVIVGVVGILQLEVFQYRMKNEYGVELRMEGLPYEEIRLIDSYPGDLTDMNLGSDAELLEDYKGRNLLVFTSYWAIDFTCRRNPGLQVSEIVVSEG